MDGLTLLRRAREAGLAVKAEGDKLVIRGPKRAAPVARLLIDHKPDVLAALAPGATAAPALSEPPAPPAPEPAPAAWGEAEAVRFGLPELPDDPVLLRDGRRLWRFPAAAISGHADAEAARLLDQARWHGAVLAADGCTLIVVERWRSSLPLEVLLTLRRRAGEVIAALRNRRP
jgi:hypothetical protein